MRHLFGRVDLGLVLDQQPRNRLVAVLGTHHENRKPVLPAVAGVDRGRGVRVGGMRVMERAGRWYGRRRGRSDWVSRV